MTERLVQVLYVEDDSDIRAVTEMALSDDGFELTICSSGREAIEKGMDIRPDLLLLDVMMPGLDGPSTLQKLRVIPHLKTTPVIFMTAKVQSAEIEQYKALGAIGIISKPFDPMGLSDQLMELFKGANDQHQSK